MEDSYDGRYQKLQKIGAGKYGIIYKVRRLVDNKQFIAKHVLLHTIEKQKALQQLKIIQKLRFLYIVEYVDSFVQKQDVLIIIMQYCGQRDLSYHIQQMKLKKKHFNQHLIINWTLQLVLALQYIHSKRILHRDIKPQNIFIDKDMNLKVGDFGISKVLDHTQQAKTIVGTPIYLPPQICNQQKYTNKADIWSLGCVLYQICSLEKPFSISKGIYNLLQEIKFAQIKPIPQIYSKSLNDLVLKMLTRDHKKRPSAAQLLKDPILVQLMINNSSQINLKKEYPKTIDINIQKSKPKVMQSNQQKPITQSFINRHTDIVHAQLKKFENQVKEKMNALKKKPLARKDQIDEYYQQVKRKMKDIQKAVQIAFQEIKQRSLEEGQKKYLNKIEQNENNNDSEVKSLMMSTIKKSKPLIKKNNFSKNSIEDSSSSSDITINSVFLGQQSKKINSPPSLNNIIDNNLSISTQSVMIDHSQLQKIKSGKSNLKLSSSKNVDQSLEITVKSQFTNTINLNPQKKNENQFSKSRLKQSNQIELSEQLQQKSMKQLQFLQNTLLKNPQALLDQTFMNCTLSISNDNTFLTNNLNSFKRKNINPNKIDQIEQSISFDFLKKEILQLPKENQQYINEYIRQQELQDSSINSLKSNTLKNQKKQQKNNDYQNEQYQADFQPYEDSFQHKLQTPNKKRLQQMNSVYSFYQQALNEINNQSSMSGTEMVRRKYPLNLSLIKEQSNQGSMVTQNSTHSNFNQNTQSNFAQNTQSNFTQNDSDL